MKTGIHDNWTLAMMERLAAERAALASIPPWHHAARWHRQSIEWLEQEIESHLARKEAAADNVIQFEHYRR